MIKQQPVSVIVSEGQPRNMVEVSDLRKSYTTGLVSTEVLKGVGMKLGRGEIGVILGPSGSGKTTLMNIIGGIDRGNSGCVCMNGIEVDQLSDDQLTSYRRDHIGFVFQFYNLIPNLTVGENIEVVSNISKKPHDIDEVLAAVDMLDKKGRFPRELSGGEQQRVSIARTVVKNPTLLLCDEPTGALDYMTSRSILTLLEQVNRQYGTTLLMVTHNTAIAGMAHRVYKLRSGEIVEEIINPNTVPAERIEW
jgi:putative ABC transport system ATP-binding protein